MKKYKLGFSEPTSIDTKEKTPAAAAAAVQHRSGLAVVHTNQLESALHPSPEQLYSSWVPRLVGLFPLRLAEAHPKI